MNMTWFLRMQKIAANSAIIIQLKIQIQLCIVANVKQEFMQDVMAKVILKTLIKAGLVSHADLNLVKQSLVVNFNHLYKVNTNVWYVVALMEWWKGLLKIYTFKIRTDIKKQWFGTIYFAFLLITQVKFNLTIWILWIRCYTLVSRRTNKDVNKTNAIYAKTKVNL